MICKIHNNVNLNTLSHDNIADIFKDIKDYPVVAVKGQQLSADEFGQICKHVGKFRHIPDTPAERARSHIRAENTAEQIVRVTGALNNEGKPGLFGHIEELGWHADKASNPGREAVVWLYGVSGTAGSITSWIDTALAYNDLDSSLQQELKNYHLYCGYKKGTYSNEDVFVEHVNKDWTPCAVQTFGNRTGLYFPYYQTFGIVELDNKQFVELADYLWQHMNQEKYMYHHHWEDGDLVIHEQWLSLHKRHKFDHMDKRILYRAVTTYDI